MLSITTWILSCTRTHACAEARQSIVSGFAGIFEFEVVYRAGLRVTE